MNNFQIAKKHTFVTRQTLASWENGESIPQAKKIEMLKEQGIEVDRFVIPAIAKFNNLLSKPNDILQKQTTKD